MLNLVLLKSVPYLAGSIVRELINTHPASDELKSAGDGTNKKKTSPVYLN